MKLDMILAVFIFICITHRGIDNNPKHGWESKQTSDKQTNRPTDTEAVRQSGRLQTNRTNSQISWAGAGNTETWHVYLCAEAFMIGWVLAVGECCCRIARRGYS